MDTGHLSSTHTSLSLPLSLSLSIILSLSHLVTKRRRLLCLGRLRLRFVLGQLARFLRKPL